MSAEHVTVLKDAAVAALAVIPDGRYVDGTYGRGGHSAAILDALGVNGRLLALDRDPEAVAHAIRRFVDEPRFCIERANFNELAGIVAGYGWTGETDGLLLDLGVSSAQLDNSERGFAFSRDGTLDMRMDPDVGKSATAWLAEVEQHELARVLYAYGEERYARRIAAAIVRARAAGPIESTVQLADIIKQAHPRWERHHHPATRSFQAIRLCINGELDALNTVLQQAAVVLRAGGRLVVISFHSLEDRMVKRCLRRPPPDPAIPRGLPLPDRKASHPWRILGKPVRPTAAEVANNPRARSAVMRIAERCAEVAA